MQKSEVSNTSSFRLCYKPHIADQYRDMLKKELLGFLVERFPEVSKSDLAFILDVFFESMSQALMVGESVEIRGLGRMYIKEHDATLARNPRSGESVKVPRRWTVRFSPSDSLLTRVNQ